MIIKKDFFIGKKFLITGPSGFIGNHFVEKLVTYRANVSVIIRNRDNFCQNVIRYTGDIRNPDFVENCIVSSQPDYIFHLAASKDRNEDIQTIYSSIETNLLGSLNILSVATKVKSIQAIIIIGTAEEYGNNKIPFKETLRESPITPYSFSKTCVSHLSELFFQSYNTPIIIIRPTIAYGPGQGLEMFIPSLITSLLNNIPFDMTLGEQTRDFVYIDDLINAVILAIQNNKAKGQIINIGSGNPVKIRDIALEIENRIGNKDLIHYGAKPYRINEIMDYCVDTRKAEILLGWKATTSLKDGLEKTIAHYKLEK
jgi:UDP-glucose 4-epimerase